MYKFILSLFSAFLSLISLSVMAANCRDGGILFDTDPSDHGYWRSGYTSANNDPLLIMQVTVQNTMTCDADYTEDAVKMSNMVINMTGGGTCKNSDTITTPYPGIEWKLEDMHCDSGRIIANNVKSVPWDSGIATWPSGTLLGKARLVLADEYWMKNTQTGMYTINIPSLSVGNTLSNSPRVSVSSTMGGSMPFQIKDVPTCLMSLSTENLDFGKLTPMIVNNGTFYKGLSIYYSCKNKALINGLYVRFSPENITDAKNGIFSARDANGRELKFQITRLYGYEQIIPLNANYQLHQPQKSDINDTAIFRIKVKPSTPFPAGKVSTYLNVSLIYR